MGVSVALVCKSMLGKAHTVMAEGGQQRPSATRTLGLVENPLQRYHEGWEVPQ